MCTMASQITGVSTVCSTVCTGADQRKHQSFASLAFVMGIHRWPVYSPQKGPVARKMFSFDDVIMLYFTGSRQCWECSYHVDRLNTLRPRQNCRHFVGYIFKIIFLVENYCIKIQIPLSIIIIVPGSEHKMSEGYRFHIWRTGERIAWRNEFRIRIQGLYTRHEIEKKEQ